MAQAYLAANTYRDTGVVRVVFIEGRHRQTTERRFKTAFVRPHRFRFEYSDRTSSDDEGRYIIWRNGSDVRTWWEIRPGVETPELLGHALGAAAGVSGGASMTVPTLLMPEEIAGASDAGARIFGFNDPVRLSDETLDGTPCCRLKVKRSDEPSVIWIGQRNYLIRRIDATSTFKTFRTEDTTLYEPVVDQEIPEPLLLFDAPLRPGAGPGRSSGRPSRRP